MLPGILAVMMMGTVAGSADSGAGRGYPGCDRGCYEGYRAHSGCGYRYDDCGRRYGGYRDGGYRDYSYRDYGYRDYSYREYGYRGYGYRDYDYGGYGE
jgi:hypothetical protein